MESQIKAAYTVAKIDLDEGSGYRVITLSVFHPEFGTSNAGTVTDYDGNGIHPFVEGCDEWQLGERVTFDPVVG